MYTSSRLWPVLAAAAFVVTACGNKDDAGKSKRKPKTKSPIATNAASNAVTRASAIADKMCACKDAACAGEVRKEYLTWAKGWGATSPDRSVMVKVNVVSTRLGKCFKKLKTAPPAFTEVKAGFQTPESVLHDTVSDVYLVSNINGSPFDADGNGFISQVAPDGSVTKLKWIDGAKKGVTLNAPKGMAIVGDLLYVADVTVVRTFDRKSGAAKSTIKVPGATFLNDMVAGKGVVYVSDMGKKAGFKNSGTDAVWQIKGTKVTPAIKDAKLGNPNGLAVIDGDLWAVNFGNAELYKVAAGKKQSAVTLPTGRLDGIEFIGGGEVLVSSWAGKAVYRGPLAGPFKVVAKGVEQPADIGWDSKRRRLLVPQFGKNVIRIYPIK